MLIILVEGSKNIILDEMYDSHKVPRIGTNPPLAGKSERAKIALCGRLDTSPFFAKQSTVIELPRYGFHAKPDVCDSRAEMAMPLSTTLA